MILNSYDTDEQINVKDHPKGFGTAKHAIIIGECCECCWLSLISSNLVIIGGFVIIRSTFSIIRGGFPFYSIDIAAFYEQNATKQ